MTTDPPKRRWFQFRVRTLLIAVLVLSLPLSWFGARFRKAKRQREAVELIERLGGAVLYEDAEPSIPQCVRESLGDDFFYDVVAISITGDFGEWLSLNDTHDAGLEHLEGLTNLKTLLLADTQITDAGLEQLKGLTNLRCLLLNNTQITDVGLEYLKGLTNLGGLSLYNTQVSDAGLEHLKALIDLGYLDLRSTNVTPEGVRKLQEALPYCKIEY